jgi:hypothetical protein
VVVFVPSLHSAAYARGDFAFEKVLTGDRMSLRDDIQKLIDGEKEKIAAAEAEIKLLEGHAATLGPWIEQELAAAEAAVAALFHRIRGRTS